MEKNKIDIAVFGALNIDIIGTATVASSPSSSLPGEVSVHTGGTGWNIARNASLLGASVSFYSVFGSDGYEKFIRSEADRYNVNINGCRWEDISNNLCLRIFNKDEKLQASITDMNPSRKIDSPYIRDSIRNNFPSCSVLVADTNLQVESLQRLTGELPDTPLVVDCVSPSKCMRVKDILDRIHTLKLGVEESQLLSGYAGPERSATALLKAGVNRVMIDLKEEGLLLADRTDMIRVNHEYNNSAYSIGAGNAASAILAMSLLKSNISLDYTMKLAQSAMRATYLTQESVNPDIVKLCPYLDSKNKFSHT